MSGTSLDGVDAALTRIQGGQITTSATFYQAYPDALRQEILTLNSSGFDELHRCALISNQLARLYADVVRGLLEQANLEANDILAIGCHGQTLRHRPEAGYTLQCINSALLAELTGISVVSDFRSRDIAAGGQGAPLVPAFHAELFSAPTKKRGILNIGGIANLTALIPGAPVTGFDCGPGNMLLDGWIHQHLGRRFDEDGRWGAQGMVIPELLETLMACEYLTLPPPKSCGREQFNLAWLRTQLQGNEKPIDVQATLIAFTADSIAQAIRTHCPPLDALYVCGGGAHNTALMTRLQHNLAEVEILPTNALGVPVNWVEAVAFAWLAYRHMAGLPGNLPSATGCRGPRILGAFYPA